MTNFETLVVNSKATEPRYTVARNKETGKVYWATKMGNYAQDIKLESALETLIREQDRFNAEFEVNTIDEWGNNVSLGYERYAEIRDAGFQPEKAIAGLKVSSARNQGVAEYLYNNLERGEKK